MIQLQRYFEENFFIIAIKKNDKRPKYKKWTENPMSYTEAWNWIKNGGNIGVVCGKQSMKDGYELFAIDIDRNPEHTITEDLNYYRKFNTLIQFTPNGGFHIIVRIKPHENVSKLESFLKEYNLTPHRTPLNPHHEDTTFKNPTEEDKKRFFADTIRWSSMYILLSPSKIDGKGYWWLDNCKGEIRKL